MSHTRILALAVLTAVFVAACGGDETGEDGQAANEGATPSEAVAAGNGDSGDDRRVVRVESMVLGSDTFEDVIQLTGAVEADNDATLSARAAGTVVSLKPLGARVAAGYVVAQVDPGIANAALDQANAQAAVAKAQFELAEDLLMRQEPLFRDSVISPVEFEQVRTQHAQAKAQLAQADALVKQAEEQVSLTRITAPFSGTVEAHFVEKGEQVAPGMQVARVVNTSRVRVAAGIPERFADDMKIGSAVRLRFNTYGVPEREARVTFVGNAIDASSRTLPIEIEVDNRDGRLKPEMIADVFVTRQEVSDAVVIPQSAVQRDEDGNSVYVINRRGGTAVAERRLVTLGNSNGTNVHVVEGLDAGDELITVGAANVAPGDAIETISSGSLTQAL